MGAVTRAEVTPRLLSWARRRRGVKASDLAKKLNVRPPTVDAWESGEKMPTFRQARKLARTLRVPFGYLYLREPPAEEMPLADFRAAGRNRPKASPDLLDLLTDVLGKQQWLREYRESEGDGVLPFVGGFAADSEAAVAGSIRDTLDVDGARRRAAGWEEFLRCLILKAEESGITVMRGGARRPPDGDEFRGFSVSDGIAPLVFINTRGPGGTQLFTLAHEMAHVWTGRGGVSNPDYGLQSGLQDSPVERFCNRVAAETLVQSEDFLSRWRTGNVPPEDNITRLRKHYKVSDMVILRQALDNGLIDLPEYQRRYAGLPRQAGTAGDSRKDAGGNFYRTLVSRNGRALTEAIIHSTARGTTLSSEAAGLLGVKVGSLPGIAEHLTGSRLGLG